MIFMDEYSIFLLFVSYNCLFVLPKIPLFHIQLVIHTLSCKITEFNKFEHLLYIFSLIDNQLCF